MEKAKEIAALKRQLKSTKNDAVKKAITKKIARLQDELEASKTPTKELAMKFRQATKDINSMSKSDFNALVRKLATKSEYSFLKGMTKNEIIDDLQREAKPVGWRFRGRTNFKKPTKSDIKQHKNVYYENRPNRSDVIHPVKLANGGGVENVKKIIDGDDVWYLTYIDSTHFFLSNSPDFKGNPYHIGQFRNRPFYNEVNQWLKSFNKYANGGGVNKDYYAIWDDNYNEIIGALDLPKSYKIITWPDLPEKIKKQIIEYINKNDKYAKGGNLKPIPAGNKGLPKLPKDVRNRMGYMAKGGGVRIFNPEDVFSTKKEWWKALHDAYGDVFGSDENARFVKPNFKVYVDKETGEEIVKHAGEIVGRWKPDFEEGYVFYVNSYDENNLDFAPNHGMAKGGGVGKLELSDEQRKLYSKYNSRYINYLHLSGRDVSFIEYLYNISEEYKKGTADHNLSKEESISLGNKLTNLRKKIQELDRKKMSEMATGGGVGKWGIGIDKSSPLHPYYFLHNTETGERKGQYNTKEEAEKVLNKKYANGGDVGQWTIGVDNYYFLFNYVTGERKGRYNTKEEARKALNKKYAEGGMMDANEENRHMVQNNNVQIMHHAEELKSAVKSAKHIPAWVVAKVFEATSALSNVTHYLDGESKMKHGGGVNDNFGYHVVNKQININGKKGIVTKGRYYWSNELADGRPSGIYYTIEFEDGTKDLINHSMIKDKMAKGGHLIGNRHKLDMNKNGRLDSEDFRILRGEK